MRCSTVEVRCPASLIAQGDCWRQARIKVQARSLVCLLRFCQRSLVTSKVLLGLAMMKRCLHPPEVRHPWGSVLVRYAVVFVSDFQQTRTLIHLHIALELIVSHFFQLLRRQIKRSNAVHYHIARNLY